ncbi:MAG: ATP-binding protein [Desulfobacteraceae bacterium]|nr:ATP-binding protein [Desulfobacteraceae bacterium]
MDETQQMHPEYALLARKMFLTILVVSYVPVLLISLTIYLQFRGVYRQKVEDHLVEMVRKHKQQIDAFLHARLADVRFLAQSFGGSTLSEEAFLQRQLAFLQSAYGATFVDLGVIDARGRQISYAGPFKLGQAEYAGAAWFQQAMAERAVISDVFLGLRGLPHFIVAVCSGEGQEAWVLRATIDFEAFNKLVGGIHIGATGVAFIVNRDGEFQTTGPASPIAAAAAFGGYQTCAVDPSRRIHVYSHPDENGVRSIYVTGLLKDRNWLLVYRQQAADAFQQLRRAEKMSLFFFILGGMLIVVMALVISRRMASRVTKADREKEIMRRQVIETSKLAGIGELAAGVAHEINNPVAVMIEEAGWIQDLMEDERISEPEDRAEIQRALQQIHTQGRRCKEITAKLLSFARGSDGSIRRLDINQIIEDVIRLVVQQAKFTHIEVETVLAPGLPPLSGSETEMHQVVLNLVNNALQAMAKDGGRLTVSSEADGPWIVIGVQDTGPGIPAAILERIFDPFFTTKPVGKGTGLGLSICYGIIKKMGGRIEVDSRVGQGTTFRVVVPVPPTAS